MSLALILAAAATTANPIIARWHTPGDKAVVEIAPCGKQLCGTIISAALLPATGAPPRDSRNPDPALRNRSIVGVRLLSGFIPDGSGWKSGTIYNPTNGKTYRSELTLGADGRLKVSGCVAIFCQTQIWRRAR
jgi:uncharacterized protein (DUF2147 family)